MRHVILAVWLMALSVCGHAQTSVPSDEMQSEARQRIEEFHAALLQAMRTPDYAARATALQPVIDASFDITRIAGISLGRTWRDLTDTQQTEFVSLLSELVVATYADRFDGYSGQQFVTDEVRAVRTGDVVRTRLLREAEADVKLDYFLRAGRVFNVVADGVSDLSLRRADYSSIIKTEGFAALLTHIQRKIDEAREAD